MEGIPINEDHMISAISHSALIWDLLDERMTGVTGVNNDPSTAYANLIVQIDNSYYFAPCVLFDILPIFSRFIDRGQRT